MKMSNNMKLIGDLQVYARPYASLYYDFNAKIFSLLIRVSKLNELDRFIMAEVSVSQIFEYLNQQIGLKTMFQNSLNKMEIIGSLTDKKNNRIKSLTSSIDLKNDELYDPEFCYEELDIIYFIEKHRKNNN